MSAPWKDERPPGGFPQSYNKLNHSNSTWDSPLNTQTHLRDLCIETSEGRCIRAIRRGRSGARTETVAAEAVQHLSRPQQTQQQWKVGGQPHLADLMGRSSNPA